MTLRRMFRSSLMMVGLAMFAVVVVAAVFPSAIAPHSYRELNLENPLAPPSLEHLFGTDRLGRDVFSRVIYGSSIALRVGLIVIAIVGSIGITLGLLAGYFGGLLDRGVSFLIDVTWAMPPLVLAMAIIMALGPGLDNVVVAIALVSWAELARVVRAKTQAVKEMSYVEAARALGCTDTRIMSRHIIPNILPPIIVLISLILPTAVLSTTALSFLGLGSQPPAPDWGVILNEGIIHLEMAPWISIFSGSAIVWTVLGFTLIGVALRDAVDPQLRAEASQRPA